MSLILTRTQNIRSEHTDNLAKYEHRPSEYGALDLYMRDSDDPNGILDNGIKTDAARSTGSTMEIPVINRADKSIKTTRDCNLTGGENTSNLVPLVWNPLAFEVSNVPAQYSNNEVKMQIDFDRKLRAKLQGMAEALDTACYARTEADRSQVVNSSFVGTGRKYGDLVANAIQVTDAQSQFFLNDMSTIMRENDFQGRYNVLSNTAFESLINLYSNQGSANATNSSFQFGAYDNYFSNRVTVDAANNYECFFMPMGTVGILFRVDRQALVSAAKGGETSGDGREFDVVQMPVGNHLIDMGVMKYTECGDQSATTGAATADLTRALIEKWEFSFDYAIVTAYNSDPATYASPIIKTEVANS